MTRVELEILEHIYYFPGVSPASLEIAVGELDPEKSKLVRETLNQLLNNGTVVVDDDLGLQLGGD